MTTTLDDVAKKKEAEQSAEQQAAAELVRMAKEQGLSITGPDGLLKQLTKTLIKTALNEEIWDWLSGHPTTIRWHAITGVILTGFLVVHTARRRARLRSSRIR